MQVRPFVLVTQPRLEEFGRCATAALASWCAAWDIDSGLWSATSAAAELGAVDGGQWQCRHARTRLFFLDCPETLLASIEVAIFSRFGCPHRSSEEGVSSMARDVARTALEELVAQLLNKFAEKGECASADTTDPPAPSDFLKPGSGAVLVRVVHGGVGLSILVPASPPARGGALSPSASPARDLAVVLGATPITVSARLGELELSIDEISGLACGDVVCLPTQLGESLQVLSTHGEVVCAGDLGDLDGHVAIKLRNTETRRGMANA